MEKKESSAIENTGVGLRNLVLISDVVYNMSMNKPFHILVSFACSLPSLKSVYRFTKLLPDTRDVLV